MWREIETLGNLPRFEARAAGGLRYEIRPLCDVEAAPVAAQEQGLYAITRLSDIV